jgi:hypothetical protein
MNYRNSRSLRRRGAVLIRFFSLVRMTTHFEQLHDRVHQKGRKTRLLIILFFTSLLINYECRRCAAVFNEKMWVQVGTSLDVSPEARGDVSKILASLSEELGATTEVELVAGSLFFFPAIEVDGIP